MMSFSTSFKLSACTLAASVLISACGGGAESTDKVAPTVAITAAAGASGAAVFTFVFSKDVGTSFVAEDIVVTGGTAGALTQVDATTYTFVVTPTGGGAVGVSVAGANFKDKALNVGVVGGSASYSPTQVSGNTGGCTAANCIGFEAANVGFVPFEGLVSADLVADPSDSSNKVAKLVKGPSGQPWAGATIFTTDAKAQTVAPINFASSKVVTMRVYSAAAGNKIRLKIETGPNAGGMEVDATTSKANQWETLTFDFGTPAAGTFDATKVYKTVSIFPVFMSAVTADTAFYFDELKFPAAAPLVAAIDFSGSAVGFVPFEGLASAAVANDPTDANNQVAKLVKVAAGQPWAGATVYTTDAKVQAVTPIDFASSKIITMRSYASAVGQKIRLKVETGPNAGGMEVDALTTKVNQWETLTFDFGTPAAGTFDATKVYNTISIFPMFMTAVTADTTFYFDDLDYRKGSVSSGGGSSAGSAFAGIFAEDYVGALPATSKTTLGGDVGFFFDSRLVKGVGATYDFGGVTGLAQDSGLGAVPNFYYGLGLNLPNIIDAYFGAYIKAPGNATVNVSKYTNLKLNVWGPDELFKAGTFPTLQVVLQGPAVAGCSSASGGSEIKATLATTTQGAGSVYTMPLANFTIGTACSGETTVGQILAKVAQVNVVLQNTAIQYVNKDGKGVAYPNGLNIGSIKFN